MRDNRHKLQEGRQTLDIRTNIFPSRTVKKFL